MMDIKKYVDLVKDVLNQPEEELSVTVPVVCPMCIRDLFYLMKDHKYPLESKGEIYMSGLKAEHRAAAAKSALGFLSTGIGIIEEEGINNGKLWDDMVKNYAAITPENTFHTHVLLGVMDALEWIAKEIKKEQDGELTFDSALETQICLKGRSESMREHILTDKEALLHLKYAAGHPEYKKMCPAAKLLLNDAAVISLATSH